MKHRAPKLPEGTPKGSMPIDPGSNFSITYKTYGPEIAGSGPKSTCKGKIKTYVFCAQNSPSPGHDIEFNNWYDKQQVPALLTTPGVVSAQRFARSDVQIETAEPSPQYLIMYKIVTDDLAAVFASIGEHAKSVPRDPAHDTSQSRHFTYQALGPLIIQDRVKKRDSSK
jgi:hypothetical protein